MLSIGSGASRLVNCVNFSIRVLIASEHRPDVRHHTGNGARRCSKRARQKGSSAFPLTPFEIAITRGHAVFARLELITVHRNAHGTASLAPVRTRFAEH